MKTTLLIMTVISLLPLSGFAAKADISGFSDERCRDILITRADRSIRRYEQHEANRLVPNPSAEKVSADKIEMLEEAKEAARIADKPCDGVKHLELEADDSLITGERQEEVAPFSQ